MIDECMAPMLVRCPIDGAETTTQSATFTDAEHFSWGRERWTSPAVMVGWTLACGHFVGAESTELRMALRADGTAVAWFADQDSQLVLPAE